MDNASPGNVELTTVLKEIAGKALTPEKREAGPGDVEPTTQTKTSPLVTMTMDEEEVNAWWARIKASDDRILNRAKEWDILLKEYLPLVKSSGEAEDVKVPKHFRNVHSKIGQLFYKMPEPLLLPKDPSPAQNEQPNPMSLMDPMAPPLKMEDIISVKQGVLQYQMGREVINYNRLMDELLFDNLAWAGIGCSKMGYICITKPVVEPILGPDQNWVAPVSTGFLGLSPTPQPPQVPQIQADGTPLTRTVEVPVYEEYYERRFSPKKLILNADLHSCRIDQDATMVGMHFYLSQAKAKVKFKLSDEDVSKGTTDDKLFKHEDSAAAPAENNLVHGVEVYIRASSFYPDREVHPQVLYQLVLIEGMTRPVVFRLSPDQTIDEQGKLTQDSFIGFPFKVLTIRDLADSPFPPADSAFTNSEIKQLNTDRRQGVLLRDAAIGHYLYDSGAFDDTTLGLLKSNRPGRYIPVESDRMQKNGAKSILDTTAQVHQTGDTTRLEQILSRDIDETLGIGSVQAGTTEETVRTATEIANVQAAVSGRNGKELGRTVDFYLDSCRKLDQLLMRYATEDDYVTITGEDGSRRIMVWNSRIISGRYLYDIAPDSQLQVDMKSDRKSLLEVYNLTANDPMVNRAYILRRIFRTYGLDPMKAVIPPAALPPAGGMVPGAPGAAPTSVAQPPHGGAAVPGSAISKHAADTSGRRPNEPGAENHRESRKV